MNQSDNNNNKKILFLTVISGILGTAIGILVGGFVVGNFWHKTLLTVFKEDSIYTMLQGKSVFSVLFISIDIILALLISFGIFHLGGIIHKRTSIKQGNTICSGCAYTFGALSFLIVPVILYWTP